LNDDLLGFDDPWEHVRLLSDNARNEALFALLRKRAPGARVLEVGAGGGLLSLVAARLGASRVYAVEPSVRVETLRALVTANGLQEVIEVIEGRIEDLKPRKVDLAFAELLNADPFAEGIFDAMDAAADWLAPGGHLAPGRLRIWMALVREDESAAEVARVRATLQALERAHRLDLTVLTDELDGLEPYVGLSAAVVPVSEPVCLVDLALGTGERPEVARRMRVKVEGDEPVRGAVIWFEAELDEGLVLANPPGSPGHWGHQVIGWPTAVLPKRGQVAVEVEVDEDEGVQVTPA
jgi:16S rRNA G966 N2-methylase RsmD